MDLVAELLRDYDLADPYCSPGDQRVDSGVTTSGYLFGSFIFPLLWTPSMMEKMLAGIT